MHQRLENCTWRMAISTSVRLEGIYQVRLHRGLAVFADLLMAWLPQSACLLNWQGGTKLGEAANKPEQRPQFKPIFSSWENTVDKAEGNFS